MTWRALFEKHFVDDSSKEAQIAWTWKRWKEERRGFAILQREIYLQEEVDARQKLTKIQPLTADEARELQEWQKELQTFDQSEIDCVAKQEEVAVNGTVAVASGLSTPTERRRNGGTAPWNVAVAFEAVASTGQI
ncbi:hypothetical protein VTN77DRAFT_5123 [Rasamsonia byssochlamydoides]|uniref:uncharacterized protein n=1 Tax=Rasamsonia byssochlamydoides TaxID=89139 RepID=UPI003742F765